MDMDSPFDLNNLPDDLTDATNPKNPSITNSDDRRELPLTINAGVAYFPTNALVLSADFTFYEETKNYNQTWNLGFGSEYYINDTWAVRSGLYTNNANSPSLKSGVPNQAEHIDIYGLSLSFSRFTRTSSITGGINYTYGEGDAQLGADRFEHTGYGGSRVEHPPLLVVQFLTAPCS